MGKLYFLLVVFFTPCILFAQYPIDKSHLNIDTTGQKDLIDIARLLFKEAPRHIALDEKKKFYFSVLPVSTAVPGGGMALVTSTTTLFTSASALLPICRA